MHLPILFLMHFKVADNEQMGSFRFNIILQPGECELLSMSPPARGGIILEMKGSLHGNWIKHQLVTVETKWEYLTFQMCQPCAP